MPRVIADMNCSEAICLVLESLTRNGSHSIPHSLSPRPSFFTAPSQTDQTPIANGQKLSLRYIACECGTYSEAQDCEYILSFPSSIHAFFYTSVVQIFVPLNRYFFASLFPCICLAPFLLIHQSLRASVWRMLSLRKGGASNLLACILSREASRVPEQSLFSSSTTTHEQQ